MCPLAQIRKTGQYRNHSQTLQQKNRGRSGEAGEGNPYQARRKKVTLRGHQEPFSLILVYSLFPSLTLSFPPSHSFFRSLALSLSAPILCSVASKAQRAALPSDVPLTQTFCMASLTCATSSNTQREPLQSLSLVWQLQMRAEWRMLGKWCYLWT